MPDRRAVATVAARRSAAVGRRALPPVGEAVVTAPRVLVAYGTRNGSTAGIAETVGIALQAEGLVVEVRPARLVHHVDGYDAVVLGGALYSRRWHPDALRFARRHAMALRGRPVWLFSSGPLDGSADDHDIPPVPGASEAMDRLAARGHATFGGRLTATAHGYIARAMVRNGRGGDFRNPDRIGTWARGIASQLNRTAVER